jgi:hypothetical protein
MMHCPAGSDGNTPRFSMEGYERWCQEHSEDKEYGGEMLLDGEPNIILVDSNITTNQIWTADNIYYVSGLVDVKALLVIEPGTEIRFDWGGLFVKDGGTLVSVGEPNNPVIYTSVYSYPSPFDFYYCAICVEETASSSTKIAYNYIEYSIVGIVTDNIRLDAPLENNYLFLNGNGIGQYGTFHTDI